MKNPKTRIFFLSVFCLAAQFLAGQTRTYSIMLNGNKAGIFRVEKYPDGLFKEYYWMNDRGRGDSLHAVWRVNANNILTELEITGHDYFKNPVRETFSLKNGMAAWESESEKGNRKLEKEAQYISLMSIGGDIIQALLANNNRVDLLPYGTATLERLGEHTPAGSTKKYRLVGIKGLGFTPNYAWLDEQDELLGYVSPWANIILEGFENLGPELLEIQNEEESKIYRKIREQAVEKPEGLLIRNVLLFDARTGETVPRSSVWVENGRIMRVTSKKIRPPKGTRIIDGKGMTLIPGLIDMHVHFQGNFDGALHLANGVTGARDLGNNFGVLESRDQIRRGEILGPDLEALAGLLDGKGQFAGPTPALAGTEAEALSWVDTFAQRGFQQVKIYSSIRPEWVPAITQKAHSLGLRVSGHIPAYMTAEQAIHAGYDEIQHMNMLFLNFYGDTIDTRSPNRFRIPAQKAAFFDFGSPECKSFLQLLKEKNIAVDPTVSIFIGMFKDRPGKVSTGFEHIIDRFPLSVQRQLRAGGGLPVPEGMDETYNRSADAFLKMVKLLYDNQITIVAGTDNLAGFSLHQELENYVKAGIPAGEVLRIATLGNATVLGKQKEIGSIEPGKRANLALIDGNPLKNMSDIRRVKWVIKDGAVYDPGKILEGISIKNYHD